MNSQSFFFIIVLSLSLLSLHSNAQDFTLEYGNNGINNFLSGSYIGGLFSSFDPINHISLARNDKNGNPIQGSGTTVGTGMNFDCDNLKTTNPANISPVDGVSEASFPDITTLKITNNHPKELLFIKFWDDGDGRFDDTGYLFSCKGQGTADYTLDIGECITLKRTGETIELLIIDPIPTLSQWGLIILGLGLSIFGLVAVRQRIFTTI